MMETLSSRSLRDYNALEYLLFLEGSYEKVPLRDGCAELMVTTNIPENHLLEAVLKEWCRVLKKVEGLQSSPTIFAREYKD